MRFLLFFVFMFAHMFNSLSILIYWFGITYLFWEFTSEISCTVPTQDLLQNLISCLLLCCHRLLLFIVFHNVFFFVILETFLSFLLFLLPAFFGHMPVLVVVKVFRLPILEIIIRLSNVYGLSSPSIYCFCSCFVIVSSFCGLVFLAYWGNCHLSLFKCL